MNNTILFEEKQHLGGPLLVVLMLLLHLLFLGVIAKQLFRNNTGNNKLLTITLLFSEGVLLLVSVLLFFSTLHTTIRKDIITVRFSPFLVQEQVYSRSELTHCYVRKYTPIQEFGGWGVRQGKTAGVALNASGNMGMQLELKNGFRVLIGTQKPQEVEAVLQQAGYQH